MGDKEAVIETIRGAFGSNEYPGEGFLQGSFEGCGPWEEVGPFKGMNDWRGIEAGFLDGHANALSFFSEAGFRFFLPAYLIADLRGRLSVADPVFHLTHGFSGATVEVRAGGHAFPVSTGKSAFVNPRRYGAATWHDYARYRLSVFTREEASAIVAYLEYKRDFDEDVSDREVIEAALGSFWSERARTAPSSESLKQHTAEQEEYLAAMRADTEGSDGGP